MSKPLITKGVQTYQKKGRKVITAEVTSTPLLTSSTLQDAVREARSPQITELIDELKCLIGTALVSLRGSNDVYKLCQAIGQATRAVGTISALEAVEDLTPEMIKDMSSEDLKQYVYKQLERLN